MLNENVKKQLNKRSFLIEVPYFVLSSKRLNLNEKLILSLDYTLKGKLGFNSYSNKEIGKFLNIHYSSVQRARKHFEKLNIELKEGKRYSILEGIQDDGEKSNVKSVFDLANNVSKRYIIIPPEVYNSPISPGAKLLYGEFNSLVRSNGRYFATRSYTANRMSCSKNSISNWTKELIKNDHIINYKILAGNCTKQRIVVTRNYQKLKRNKTLSNTNNQSLTLK
jgi:hypothetical protein